MNKTKTKNTSDLNFDPNRHLHWSKQRILLTIMLCVLLSLVLVFGFLLMQQYRQPSIDETKDGHNLKKSGSSQQYKNQNWGIGFNYPNDWYKAIGSFQDGEYYFSSEPINFVNEIGPDEGILALKTYNNWNSLSYNDWLKDQQSRFWPKGQLTKAQNVTVAGVQAQRFQLQLSQPANNTTLWDIVVISRTSATKYVFIMESGNIKAQQKFLPVLEAALSSVEFSAVSAAAQ